VAFFSRQLLQRPLQKDSPARSTRTNHQRRDSVPKLLTPHYFVKTNGTRNGDHSGEWKNNLATRVCHKMRATECGMLTNGSQQNEQRFDERLLKKALIQTLAR